MLSDASASLAAVLGEVDEACVLLANDQQAFARQFHHEAQSLARQVTEARMTPAAALFEGMRRAARDISQTLDKPIQLVTEGDDTELDKSVIDQLKGTVLHLVRNAIDHGIEDREVRRRQGKPEAGRVTLRALLRGSTAAVSVEDDGGGIDPAVMKQAALDKGVLTREQAARMGDDEALYLVFAPGFSTRQMITELSGRGFGLDAVKTTVERMGGRIVVESEPARFTRVTLEVPLLLAMTRALVFEVGRHRYALPTTSVERVIARNRKDVQTVAGVPVVVVAGLVVPMLDAATVLGQRPAPDAPEPALVIVQHLGHRVALPVDALASEEDLVVTPLGPFVGDLPLASGASVRGDGEVVVVLKPGGIVHGSAGAGAGSETRSGAARAGRKLLVVDDAMTVRELMRSLLESQGHLVDVAVDGVDGLQKARLQAYDCVVTDVEMPRMNGYELTRSLRADPSYARTPIVIVTTRMAPGDRKQGLEAGASAYFEKGAFDQGFFLETIARLVR